MPPFNGVRGGPGPAKAIRLYELRGLTYENIIPKNGFWFPVAPRTFGESGSHTWSSLRIVGLGEVAHEAGEDLEVYELDTFFPGAYAPNLCRGLRRQQDFLTPEQAVDILKKLRQEGAVFGLIVGNGEEINEKVFIEQFTWTMDAGRPLDKIVSIRFKAWEPQTIKRRGGIKLPPVPSKYQLRPGEDLQDAALRVYGDVRQWKSLARANGIPPGTAARLSIDLRAAGDSAVAGAENVEEILRRGRLRIPKRPGLTAGFNPPTPVGGVVGGLTYVE